MQSTRNLSELSDRVFQILDNLGRKQVRLWQVVAILQRLVLQPENIQVRLVTFHQLVVVERPPAAVGADAALPLGLRPGRLPLVPVLGIEALDELIQVGPFRRADELP
jgi:hypothetical protein